MKAESEARRRQKVTYMREYTVLNADRINANRRSRHAICKPQRAEVKRAYREKNLDRVRAQEKASRLRNIEACRHRCRDYRRKHRERLVLYSKQWHKANRDLSHALKTKKKYGLEIGEYNAMLKSQGGVCAICRGPETQVDRRTGLLRRLAVDHDHANSRNRGLLCHACNIILGHVKDDPKKLLAAASYLVANTPSPN